LTPGLSGEQPRLLGVGAKAAGDAYEEAGLPARGGREPVERERDIGPHGLAHAGIVRTHSDSPGAVQFVVVAPITVPV